MSSFFGGALSGFTDTAIKKRTPTGSGGGPAKKMPKVGSLPMTRPAPPSAQDNYVGSYKRGGKIKRSGMAKVHRGERVLTKRQAKRYRRAKGR